MQLLYIEDMSNVASSSRSCFICPICQFESPTIALNLSHLRLLHGNEPRFSVQCGVGGCVYTGRSFSALYSHIYRHHPDCGVIQKILKLKEIQWLSQAAIDDIVHEWGGIFSHTVQLINSRIREVLSSGGIDLNSIDGLNEVFEDVPNPFVGLETRYLQEKYYLEELGLVVSFCGFGVCNFVKIIF